MSEDDDSPEIKEVLKALNHVKRRDMLIYLKDLGRETGFSELMDYLNVDPKSSGQFSYHIKLLTTAHLVLKQNDKYSISPLGLKACSMLDLVDLSEKNDSLVQKISNSFKNISATDQVIISFIALSALMFIMPLVDLIRDTNHVIQMLPMFVLLIFNGLILFLAILIYSYYKLRYLPSLLVLSSLIWVIFLPYNQIKIGIIYIFSVFGIIFLYQGLVSTGSSSNILINYLLATICFIFCGLTVIEIFYGEYIKKRRAG